MRFSYSDVWAETMRMMKSHGSLILAVAGVFLFLPTLLTGYLIPAPESGGSDPLTALVAYYEDNVLWLLLGSLVNAIGAIAIYLLLFDGGGRTVGGAIGAALPILPFYFLVSIIVSVVIGIGLALLIVPGLYLIGRIALAGTAMVAEHRLSPIAALRASWEVTRGRGWATAGLVILVALAGAILSLAITAVLGSVFLLLGGRESVGGLLVLILNSALTAVFYTVLIVLFAAIYQRLRELASSSTSGT